MSSGSSFIALLRERFSLAGDISQEDAERLWGHFELLSRWNRVINLTGVHSMEQVVVRHYCESLFLALHLPAEAVSVVDVGSGAGFPGIPMAVVRPDCRLTLAESHARKVAFLKEATRDLPQVRVYHGRAESLPSGFDWLTSRAVAWRELREFAARLAKTIGLLVGSADAEKIMSSPGFEWRTPEPLPWGGKGVLLLGTARST